MRSLFYTVLFAGSILVYFSCEKDVEDPVELGYEYHPLSKGNSVTYQVDSIVWDEFAGTVDTFHYEIRESIGEVFIDNENRESRKINRFKRVSDTASWSLKDVWYATRTNIHLERMEEDVRYVRLLFPVGLNKTWDGNAKNILETRKYEYTSVHKSEELNSLKFDSVTTVLQIDEKNLIEEFYAEEKYAAGIGMIYKRYRKLETEIDGTIKSGVDYTMTVKDYSR